MKEISAGGVVYREGAGQLAFLFIEDRYSRWTLPKGKKEPGETNEETALREIQEETGIIGKVKEPLETITYTYFHPQWGQVVKEVHYFLVEAITGELRPQLSEITEVVWLSPSTLWKKQQQDGYNNNDTVINRALKRLGQDFIL